METQTQPIYTYRTFSRIADAIGATHTSTRRKIHHWSSDRYSLVYYAKDRSFEIARQDAGTIVYVDATLTPGIVGPLTDEERRILAAAGLPIEPPTHSEAPGREQAPATTEAPPPAPIAPEKPARTRNAAPAKPRRAAAPKPAPEPTAYKRTEYRDGALYREEIRDTLPGAITKSNDAVTEIEHDAAGSVTRARLDYEGTHNTPPSDTVTVTYERIDADRPTAPAAAEAIRVDFVAFKAALTATKPTVPAKTALPILGCALIAYADGWMTITTTNLEAATTRRISAAGSTPARYVIDHKALTALTATKADSLTITPAEKHGATITSSSGAATVPGMDPAQYPTVPTPPADGPRATVNRGILLRAMTNAAAAAAKDDSRPVLSGILIDTKHGAPAMLYAADGFRAHACPLDYEGELPAGIIPARIAAVISKAIETDARAVTITSTPAAGSIPPMLHVATERTTISARMIEGTFPDMQQIIPREFEHDATFNRAAMLSAVQNAEKIAQDNNDVVRFTLDHDAASATVSATNAEGGSYSATVPMEHTGPSDPHPVAFNGKYVIDALKCSTEASIRLRFNTPHNPGLWSDSVDRFLIMPMIDKDSK